MTVKPIKTERDYQRALKEINKLRILLGSPRPSIDLSEVAHPKIASYRWPREVM
jgi:antitoxin component HigA of HigAB toxin-antitoxin module